MNEFERYQQRAAELLRDPDDPTALCNQFHAVGSAVQQSPALIALIRRSAAIAPDEHMPAFNLGSALNRSGKYRESLKWFHRAMELAPDDRKATTLHHIGMAHNDLGDNKKAIYYYDMALQLAPDDKDIGQSRAISRLFMGELREGLHEFEVRLHKPARKAVYSSGIPVWKGESLAGKCVIVTHEQGFGDTLQFIRFLPMLKRVFRPAHITFAGPNALTTLLRRHFEIDQWSDEEGPFGADYICSLMAMTAHLGVQYRAVTGERYMTAEPFALPDRGALKVGIVWQGSYSYSQNARRSMFLDDFCPLFAIPGAAFYSLQVGPGAKEISQSGLDGFIADLTCKIKDWSDTASAIMAVDVIVGVDTGTMHLAGALGKRTLMMLPFAPCWRWLRDRTDTPWYRNTKLYRQAIPGVWPINAVKTELERMVHERRQATQPDSARGQGPRAVPERSILECMQGA